MAACSPARARATLPPNCVSARFVVLDAGVVVGVVASVRACCSPWSVALSQVLMYVGGLNADDRSADTPGRRYVPFADIHALGAREAERIP
jgi:hypothetical protein